jgi:hypothetical protein
MSGVSEFVEAMHVNPRVKIKCFASVEDEIWSPRSVNMCAELGYKVTAAHDSTDGDHLGARYLTSI